MRLVLGIVSLLLAALCLGYFGLVAFSVGGALYANYDVIEWQGMVVDRGFYGFIALTLGSLVLGVAFLFAGFQAISRKPRQQE